MNWLIYNTPKQTPEGWIITVQADNQNGEVPDTKLFDTKEEADNWILEQILSGMKTKKKSAKLRR